MITTTLPRAWKAFMKRKQYLIPIVLLEFVFLFVLAQLHFSFFIPSSDAAQQLNDIMMDEMQQLADTELYQLETVLMNNTEFMQAYHTLLTYIAFLIGSMFLAWLLFKTPIWHLAHKTITKKVPFNTTILKFPLLSLFWFFTLAGLLALYTLFTDSTSTILPFSTSPVVTLLVGIILLAILYFSQISFALIPSQQTFKNTFIYGTKHALTIIPAFLVNLLILFVVFTLPFRWIELFPLLSLAIILFITIPALAFTRIHMIVATWLNKTH